MRTHSASPPAPGALRTHGQSHSHRHRHRHGHRHRQSHRHRHTHRQIHRHTHTQPHTQTKTQTEPQTRDTRHEKPHRERPARLALTCTPAHPSPLPPRPRTGSASCPSCSRATSRPRTARAAFTRRACALGAHSVLRAPSYSTSTCMQCLVCHYACRTKPKLRPQASRLC